MHPPHARRITSVAITLAIALTACTLNNGYVLDVTIDGGDRTLALGEPLTLATTVTNRAGATDRVTWTSSVPSVATVDTTGLVTTLAQGPTQITATSTSDPSKNDTITLTITEPNAVTNLTIDGGDRTIVLGDPLTLTATITTTGTANDAITWTSSDPTVATIDTTGTVTSTTDGTTDLTATSVFDPSQSDTVTLTVDPRGALRWTRQFGTSEIDRPGGVATDANGNVYVTGYTYGALEGTNAGDVDAFLRAYDPNGNTLWTRQFGTSSSDVAYGVATDANGHIYVTGYTNGTLEGTNAGDYDAFLRAYDPNGNTLWTRQFGTSSSDYAYGVATDANGHIYVTGYTNGTLEGTNAGGNDAFLRAYDPNGNTLWTRQFGTSGGDYAYGVATDANGHIYVTGYTNGSLDGANAGNDDAFLRAYDPNGNTLWTRQFGTSGGDYAYGVATDANGHVYVTGYTFGGLGGANAGNGDAFLRAYDPNGNTLWTRQFGTSGGDYAYGVATDTNGNVYVTGSTNGVLEGADAGSTFLRAYDPNGDVLWTRQFGTSSDAEHVATDANGNVYVAGYTYGALEGANAGFEDAFVRSYGR